MEYREKEIAFFKYCPKCKYHLNKESDNPCAECLTYPSNEYSHRPIKYEEEKNISIFRHSDQKSKKEILKRQNEKPPC